MGAGHRGRALPRHALDSPRPVLAVAGHRGDDRRHARTREIGGSRLRRLRPPRGLGRRDHHVVRDPHELRATAGRQASRALPCRPADSAVPTLVGAVRSRRVRPRVCGGFRPVGRPALRVRRSHSRRCGRSDPRCRPPRLAAPAPSPSGPVAGGSRTTLRARPSVGGARRLRPGGIYRVLGTLGAGHPALDMPAGAPSPASGTRTPSTSSSR